jgi:hypothetical protein
MYRHGIHSSGNEKTFSIHGLYPAPVRGDENSGDGWACVATAVGIGSQYLLLLKTEVTPQRRATPRRKAMKITVQSILNHQWKVNPLIIPLWIRHSTSLLDGFYIHTRGKHTLYYKVFKYNKALYHVWVKALTDKIDLDEMERSTWREANSDGIMELLLGVLLFFMAGVWAEGFSVLLLFFPIFGNRVIEKLKARFTYPRIGYVEIRREDGKSLGWGILGYVIAAIAVISVMITFAYGGDWGGFDVYRWVPLFIGAMFLGGMIYLHGKSGDPMAYVYAFVALVSGGIFTMYELESSKRGIELYLLSLAGFFMMAGVIRLLTFMRRNPVMELPEANNQLGSVA